MPDTDRLINKAQGDDIISALVQIAANILQVPSEKLIIDWSYTTLPASGDDHTIYAIPMGDADDPWNFYVWNAVDEEWVQFDWTFAVDSALSTASENPVQNKVVTTALGEKVDKVTGKGLSTNDYTTAEKDLVATIPDKADASDILGAITITGNPITLTDGSETYADELSVDLEPIQDLHGYDKPWVGGAGKNLLPMTVERIKAANTSGTWSGNAYTLANVSFTVLTNENECVTGIKANASTAASGNVDFFIPVPTLTDGASYILNGGCAGGSNSTYKLQVCYGQDNSDAATSYTGEDASFTKLASYSYICRIRVYSGQTISNKIFYPMLRISSVSDPTFEPYTNISPIQGYDIVSIGRCGKNLFNSADIATNTVPDITNNGRLTTQNGTDTTEHFIPLKPSTTYTISGNPRIRFWLYGANGDYLDTYLQDAGQFTTNTQTYFIRISGNSGWQSNSIQIEENTSATTYEAYKGQRISLQLGNKNLLPMTVEGIKAANSASMFSWSGNVCTVYGGTITILTDENGNVTGYKVNGTFNTDTYFVLASGLTKSGNTILNGCPSGGATNTYMLFASSPRKYDTGNGVEITDLSDSTIYLYIEHGQNMSNKIFYPMLRDANVIDPTFSPYNPTLGGMVYGGQLTLKDDGSAVFVGDRACVDLSNISFTRKTYTWSDVSGYYWESANVTGMKVSTETMSPNSKLLSDRYVPKGNYDLTGDSEIGIDNMNPRFIVATVRTSSDMQPTGFTVYPLATPFTIHLSAEQLKLLQGTNNVWSNAGNVTLKYQPDNVIAQPKADVQRLRDDVDNMLVGNASKNLFNKNGTQTTTYGTATIDGEKITCTGTYYCQIDMPLKADVFTVSAKVKSYGATHGFRLLYEDGSTSSMADSMTVDTNGKNVKALLLYCGTGTSATTVYEYVQVERGSSPTAYEEYYPSNRELYEMIKALQS